MTDNFDNIEETEGDRPAVSSFISYALRVSDELADHRLDYAVSRELGISRNYAARLIKGGNVVSCAGRRVKPSLRLELGEEFSIDVPPPERLELEPEDVPFEVVYADRDIIVVYKPAGIVVHPSPGHWRGTLVHGLLFRFPDIGSLNGVERPGIVHRLDAGTSGLMVVARNGLAQEKLWADFKERRVRKRYLALCFGEPRQKRFRVDLPIARDPNSRVRMAIVEGGRNAVTDFEVLWTRDVAGERCSLLKCELHTGRTHQIRVHMKAAGCPLVGDELYAPRRASPFDPPRVFLHSWRLSFRHPRDGREMSFISHLPPELVNLIKLR